MYVLMCVYVFMYIHSMELDSTRSEPYAYYPINNLNTYLIYLDLQRY